LDSRVLDSELISELISDPAMVALGVMVTLGFAEPSAVVVCDAAVGFASLDVVVVVGIVVRPCAAVFVFTASSASVFAGTDGATDGRSLQPGRDS